MPLFSSKLSFKGQTRNLGWYFVSLRDKMQPHLSYGTRLLTQSVKLDPIGEKMFSRREFKSN